MEENTYPQEIEVTTQSQKIADMLNEETQAEPDVQQYDLVFGLMSKIEIPPKLVLKDSDALPDYIKPSGTQLIVSGTKDAVGSTTVKFIDYSGILPREVSYQFDLTIDPIDSDSMLNDINSILGSNKDNFGIYVYDNIRKQDFSVNVDSYFNSASIGKIPFAVLTLRDIDAGKASFNDTYPIQDNLKFSYEDPLGELPDGTAVTLDSYLKAMISESNNTAWLHLDRYLSQSGDINQRIINELGVNPYFLNPPQTTTKNVGDVFIDILNSKTLSKQSSDYLINLMKNADPSLKEGIGLGLPTGISYANKLGFLDTDTEVSYQDAAIVYGEKTNYVLVILDKNTNWDTARGIIQRISTTVYDGLNK